MKPSDELKRVVYFLDPAIVQDVKMLATAKDCDQSAIVDEALRRFIAESPPPMLRTKGRSKVTV